MAAFLKVRDQRSKASDQRPGTQQLIRKFDKKGVSGWNFAKDDIGFMCEYFVLPHLTDPDTQHYYDQVSDNN